VIGLGFAAYFGQKYYVTMRDQQMKERFELVDRILGQFQ
jgi:hypothetical protein